MADTVFVNGATLTDEDWFNDVNRLHYTILGDPANAAAVRTALSIPSSSEAVLNTVVDAKGDIITGTAADTIARRAAPANGSLLLADSTQASGWIDSTSAAARKNAIIGGDFSTNPWQRGTSFAAIASGTYHADRWNYNVAGTAVHTASKSADAPTVAEAGVYSTHCLLVDCTTIDAAIAAGDYCFLRQVIEGYNFIPLAQKAMTLSFWHKHTKTGIYCVGFNNSAADRSYLAEYTQTTTDTWEKATITISASPSAGTWTYANLYGLGIIFTVAAGSTYQTTAGSWQTGNFFVTSNQVNGVDNAANNFRIALVQLETGSVATAFEQRTIQEELALCQRYYVKTFPQGVAPVQNGGVTGVISSDFAYGAGVGCIAMWSLPVTMRTSPTVVTYNPNVANASFRNQGNTADVATAAAGSYEDVITIQLDTSTVAGNRYIGHVTGSAEL